jgi:hypothetical protein
MSADAIVTFISRLRDRPWIEPGLIAAIDHGLRTAACDPDPALWEGLREVIRDDDMTTADQLTQTRARDMAPGGCAMSAPLTRPAALDRLAQRLYHKLEHIDPSGITWDDLNEGERDIYRNAIEFVFCAPREILENAIDSDAGRPRRNELVYQDGQRA